jgi:hypothetical protein
MRKTVVKVSSRGNLYLDWEPMPRVPDEYLKCVVYLYPDIATADAGGRVGGTGFLVGIKEGQTNFYYIVTNKHVIDDGNSTVRFNTISEKHEAYDYDERNWFKSANSDVAIYPMMEPIPKNIFLHAVEVGQFLTKETMARLDIGIGSEVFFAGRFINAEGKEKNRPSLRFGTIAQTQTDIIDGVESFLVEARSIPGYSGSPVFTYTTAGAPMNVVSSGLRTKSFGPFLFGIDWSHILDYVDAKDERGNKLAFKIRNNSGMMGVIPAWHLLDLLYRKDVLEMRDNDPRKQRASSPDQASTDAASRDAASNASEANPNAREDFTSLLNAAARKQKQGG